MNTETRSLARDEGGAIMVLGIFMCVLMVGALWYLAGIGDAILYRERVQEASDAVAFSTASMHARGMNLLVLLNLLMAIILGIRVALKALQLVCVVLAAVFAVICILPFGVGAWACGFPGPLANAASQLQSLINSTREPINKAIKALSKVQVGIAKGTPLASTAGSIMVGNKYSPMVSFAAGFIDHRRAAGLQVEESTEDKLCGKAGESVPALLRMIFDKVGLGPVGAIFGRLEGAVGKLVRAGGAYFCEIGSGGASPDAVMNDMFREGAQETCNGRQDGLRQQYNKDVNDLRSYCSANNATCGIDPFNPTRVQVQTSDQTSPAARARISELQSAANASGQAYASFDEDRCRRDEEARFRRDAQGGGATPGQSQPPANGQGMTPKRLIASGTDEFYDGCPMSQIIGWSWSNKAILDASPGGVRIASFSRPESAVAANQPAFAGGGFAGQGVPAAIAQAEYFYDCGAGTFRTSRDCDLDEEAMWHFRWRPRFRRYNEPYSDVKVVTTILAGAYRFHLGRQVAARGLTGLHPANIALRAEVTQGVAGNVFLH